MEFKETGTSNQNNSEACNGRVSNNNSQTPSSNTRLVSQESSRDINGICCCQLKTERYFKGCSQWWIVAGVALVIGAIGLVAISILKVRSAQPIIDHGLVIDAGSSHTKTFQYDWEADKHNGTAVAQEVRSCSQDVGISSFEKQPKKAGDILKRCLNFTLSHIPSFPEQNKTRLYLGATAGMRLLNITNPSASDAIMDSVRNTMASYPYNFTKEQAVIITGKEEGSYSWITANYLLDRFGKVNLLEYYGFTSKPELNDLVGALDLGGASTQITFSPKNYTSIPDEDLNTLQLYGHTHHIYSHSYLCYGANEATRQYNAYILKNQSYNKIIKDPCRQVGDTAQIYYKDIIKAPCTLSNDSQVPSDVTPDTKYTFQGTGNSTECKDRVRRIFHFGNCSDCTFDGARQPPVHGNYVAFSTFYSVVKDFNFTGSFPLQSFRDRYKTACELPTSFVSIYKGACFDAHYIDILLTEGYNFTEKSWQHINFIDKIKDTEVGWSLGFILNRSNMIPAEYPVPAIDLPVFIILVIVFACFIALAICFAFYAMSSHSQKGSPYETLHDNGSV